MFPVGQKKISRFLFIYLTVFFVLLSILHVSVNYFVIRRLFIREIRTTLQQYAKRVQHDFSFNGSIWDTQKYLADPQTPHPNGSSGFSKPLYIVTRDGFVIERSSPISGFLDTSDFTRIRSFSTPQYLTGDTNERWRVLSNELIQNGTPVGVIFVSKYEPSGTDMRDVDEDLRKNIDILRQKIEILPGGEISVEHVDIRNVQYDVSFEIVTMYNKVLLNNGRTPSFIDPSYVENVRMNPKEFITDSISQELFYVYTDSIKSEDGKEQGVVVVADSLSDMQVLLRNFFVISFLFGVGVVIPLSYLFSQIIRGWIRLIRTQETQEREIQEQQLPLHVWFDKKKSEISVDTTVYPIAYASNQYYVCEALFAFPKKRWETDELLDRFGSTDEAKNSRTLYDAVLALNRKFLWKLIVYKDKTYQLNPELVDRLARF
jgi:hypothetical protein